MVFSTNPPLQKGNGAKMIENKMYISNFSFGPLPPQLHIKRETLPKWLREKIYSMYSIGALDSVKLTPLLLMFCSLFHPFVGVEYIVLIYWLWHVVGSWKLISLYQSCSNYHAVNIAILSIIVFTFICINFIFTFWWYHYSKLSRGQHCHLGHSCFQFHLFKFYFHFLMISL